MNTIRPGHLRFGGVTQLPSLGAACSLLSALVLGGCINPTWQEGEITYAEAPTIKGLQALTLNVESPKGSGPFPAIIMVHGGGWASGDLSTYDAFTKRVKRAGFVAVNINYRLSRLGDDGQPGAVWPAHVQDVRCAARWLTSNAQHLNVDPSRVGIMGDSAGGHLAMMTAYSLDDPTFDASFCKHRESVRINAVGSLFGVSDLIVAYHTGDWYIKPTIVNFLGLPDGASPESAPKRFREANPTYWVARGPRLPTYIIHGSADTLIPPPCRNRLRRLRKVQTSTYSSNTSTAWVTVWARTRTSKTPAIACSTGSRRRCETRFGPQLVDGWAGARLVSWRLLSHVRSEFGSRLAIVVRYIVVRYIVV